MSSPLVPSLFRNFVFWIWHSKLIFNFFKIIPSEDLIVLRSSLDCNSVRILIISGSHPSCPLYQDHAAF